MFNGTFYATNCTFTPYKRAEPTEEERLAKEAFCKKLKAKYAEDNRLRKEYELQRKKHKIPEYYYSPVYKSWCEFRSALTIYDEYYWQDEEDYYELYSAIFDEDVYDDKGNPLTSEYIGDHYVYRRFLFHDELIQAAAHPKRVKYAMNQCEDIEEFFNNV